MNFWRTENSFSKKSDESKTPTQSRPCTTKIDSLSCLDDDARKAKTIRFFRRVKPRQSGEKKRTILETRYINIVIHFDRFLWVILQQENCPDSGYLRYRRSFVVQNEPINCHSFFIFPWVKNLNSLNLDGSFNLNSQVQISLDLWYSTKSNLSNSTSNSSKLNSTRRKLHLESLVGLGTRLLCDSCLTCMHMYFLKCRCTALGWCLLSHAAYFFARWKLLCRAICMNWSSVIGLFSLNSIG